MPTKENIVAHKKLNIVPTRMCNELTRSVHCSTVQKDYPKVTCVHLIVVEHIFQTTEASDSIFSVVLNCNRASFRWLPVCYLLRVAVYALNNVRRIESQLSH